MSVTYLDSSAIVKLAVEEPESAALRRHLGRRLPVVSSALARTEVARALLRQDDAALARGRLVLSRLDLVRISARVLAAAGVLEPPEVRSLDAIHLATALQLGTDLREVVTYDDRMRDAAKDLGLRTAAPA